MERVIAEDSEWCKSDNFLVYLNSSGVITFGWIILINSVEGAEFSGKILLFLVLFYEWNFESI